MFTPNYQQFATQRSFRDLLLPPMQHIPLPEHYLRIERDLHMVFSAVEELPSDLRVGRDLIASSSQLASLPKDLQVGRSLYIESTAIEEIPDIFPSPHPLRRLQARNCRKLQAIPPGTYRVLDLAGCLSMTYLPRDLEVTHRLVIPSSLVLLPGFAIRGKLTRED